MGQGRLAPPRARWLDDDLNPAAARFTAHTGTLVAPEDDIRRLVAGRPSATLARVGAVDRRGRPHPELWDVAEAMRDPRHGVARLAYRGRALEVWRGTRAVALLMPTDADGCRTLVQASWSSLPAAIARAAGLRGKPRPGRRLVPVAELGAHHRVERWWRLLCGPTVRSPGAVLEVVDTVDGLFVVTSGCAVPSTAPAVSRLVAAATDGLPTIPPLHHLPADAELPRGWAR